MHKLPVNLYDSAIVSYAGSLGLGERTGPWQAAYQYRPKLSGIIYCAQLLFLEHHTRKQQAGKEKDFTQSIADCVKEWMTHLSSSPIGWLNELRAYAYIIAQSYLRLLQILEAVNCAGNRVHSKGLRPVCRSSWNTFFCYFT